MVERVELLYEKEPLSFEITCDGNAHRLHSERIYVARVNIRADPSNVDPIWLGSSHGQHYPLYAGDSYWEDCVFLNKIWYRGSSGDKLYILAWVIPFGV